MINTHLASTWAHDVDLISNDNWVKMIHIETILNVLLRNYHSWVTTTWLSLSTVSRPSMNVLCQILESDTWTGKLIPENFSWYYALVRVKINNNELRKWQVHLFHRDRLNLTRAADRSNNSWHPTHNIIRSTSNCALHSELGTLKQKSPFEPPINME